MAGPGGGNDLLDAVVEVDRRKIEDQVVPAGVQAVGPVGSTDVADPGPVLDLLALLGHRSVHMVQRHGLADPLVLRAAE